MRTFTLVSDVGSSVLEAATAEVLAIQLWGLTPWEWDDVSVIAGVLWAGRLVDAVDYDITVVPGELVPVRMRPRERNVGIPEGLTVGLT